MTDDAGLLYEGDALLEHLRGRGVLPAWPLARFRATPLTGGVSSRIVLIEGDGIRLVAKQARAQLAVAATWLSDPARAGREIACIDLLAGPLGTEHVPRIVWRDAEHDGYVMGAAPAAARTWKDELLDEPPRTAVVEAAARLLADLHGVPLAADERALFEDVTIFEQLRLEPFYGTIAERHPEVAATVAEHRAALLRVRRALVHGDFSPKNMLVWDERLLLLDYEVAHWGDPAFDVAFVLCHLALHGFTTPAWRREVRAAMERFWDVYRAAGPGDDDTLEQRVVGNYACLLLARIDGTSPVDHLERADARDRVRGLALDLLRERPDGLAHALTTTETTQGAL